LPRHFGGAFVCPAVEECLCPPAQYQAREFATVVYLDPAVARLPHHVPQFQPHRMRSDASTVDTRSSAISNAGR
jgi:hypothetical protein